MKKCILELGRLATVRTVVGVFRRAEGTFLILLAECFQKGKEMTREEIDQVDSSVPGLNHDFLSNQGLIVPLEVQPQRSL